MGSLPVSNQIREFIINNIASGTYMPGDFLPSENTLARQFGLHRNTIRNIYTGLENTDLIVSRPGVGWMVKAPEKSFNIGIVRIVDSSYRPNYPTEFASRFSEGMQNGCRKHNFSMTSCSAEMVEKLLNNTSSAPEYDLLMWPHINEQYHPQLLKLSAGKIPMLVVNRLIPGCGVPCVAIDQYYSSRELVSRLTAAGHKRIGCLVPDYQYHYIAERVRGYNDALNAAGIAPEARMICHISRPNDIVAARRKVRDYLKRLNGEASAFFVASEVLHNTVFKTMENAGMSIPEDVSLVTFDRVINADIPIVSVDQPLEKLAERACDAAAAILNGETYGGEMLFPSISCGMSIKNLYCNCLHK